MADNAGLMSKIFSKVRGVRNAALIGGGLAGAATYFALSSRGSRQRPEMEPLAPIPQILTPQDLVASAPMMMQQEAGPMDGRAQDYWQQTVAAQRGGQDQNIGNPSQPRMSAISPENVGNLGAMPVLS